MGQFLDKTGLSTLWTKIKGTFVLIKSVKEGYQLEVKNSDAELNIEAGTNTGVMTTFTVNPGGVKVNDEKVVTETELPTLATAIDAGLIKVSSVNSTAVTVNSEATVSGRYYPIELNSDGKAIVNVPWNDYAVVEASSTGTSKGLVTQAEKYRWNQKAEISDIEDALTDYPTTQSMVSTVTKAFTDYDEDAEAKFAKKTDITTVMRYKGTVASVSALPTTENVLGDVWNVSATGANYAWNGEQWDELSGVTDLSGYVTKTNAITGLSVSGKTITYTKGDGTTGTITTQDTNTTYDGATASKLGLIKVSSVNSSAVTVNSESTTSGRYYPIELNSDGKAIVNVPWTDTDTTYTALTTDEINSVLV